MLVHTSETRSDCSGSETSKDSADRLWLKTGLLFSAKQRSQEKRKAPVNQSELYDSLSLPVNDDDDDDDEEGEAGGEGVETYRQQEGVGERIAVFAREAGGSRETVRTLAHT